jgi:hypothetical protein
VPLALKLKLGALGAWPKIEPKIIEKLEGILRRVDSDGKPIPLDRPTIDNAHRWLVAQFVLPDHLVEPPTFALRIYHYFKAKNPPEASLLNSFFLAISHVERPLSARTPFRLACEAISASNVRRRPSIYWVTRPSWRRPLLRR